MMWKRTKFLPVFAATLMLAGCSILTRSGKDTSGSADSLTETRYYLFFTEGTKHALFGNNKTAVDYYKKCTSLRPDASAPYYQMSSIYLKNNQAEIALQYAQKAVQLNAQNEWYLLQLANIYKYIGKSDSAIYYYSKVLKIKENDELRYTLAMLYLEKGNSNMALQLITEMSNENLNSREVMLIKHNVYNTVGKSDSALYWLENVVKTFPDDINSRGMLAEYLTEMKQYDRAKTVYDDILTRDSMNGLVFLSYGEFYSEQNKWDSANIYYHKAFCNSDLPTDEKINVSVSLMSKEKFISNYDSSLIDWMDCIPLVERKFPFYAVQIDLLMNRMEYALAKPLLDSALVYKRDNFNLWEQALLVNNFLHNDSTVALLALQAYKQFPLKKNLLLVGAYAYKNMEKFDKAEILSDSLIQPEIERELRIQGYMLLGELYHTTGDHIKSDSAFDQVLYLDPENSMVLNNYAYYLTLRNVSLDKALKMSRKALDSDPASPTYLDTYGWVLYKTGAFAEAATYVARAIRNGAYENAEVLEHYGDIMWKLNKCVEAREAYETVLQIDSLALVKEKLDLIPVNCEK